MPTKLIIFASSSYPLPVLDKIQNDSRFLIGLVITRPDRPIGRKKIISPNPVKLWAEKNKIPVICPENFIGKNTKEVITRIKEVNPTLGLVAHYGLKIPQAVFSLPHHQTLNIHFSLLPKYRGGAPLEHTIINGDKKTGITVLKLDKDFDTGNIVYQKEIELAGNETVAGLYYKLFDMTANIIPDVLIDYINGQLIPKEQKGAVIFANKKELGDGKIDWKKKPEFLERFIRALNPNPGTWTEILLNRETGDKKRLKILKAHLDNGILIFDEVQLEGKTPVSYTHFQKSYPNTTVN